MKATILVVLIGLWLALNPTPTRAGPLPPGVSDQVVFTSPSFNQPQTFNFLNGSSESASGFFTFSAPATAVLPGQSVFGMGENPPCGQAFGCQSLSDILSFETAVAPGTGNKNLTFSFQSDLDPGTIPSLGSFTGCIEGAVGCGVGAFHVVSATSQVILTATVFSNADVAAVPEPSTLVLIGSGLAGLAVWGRKIKRI